MKCPHCGVEFHDQPKHHDLGNMPDGYWSIVSMLCPRCMQSIFYLLREKEGSSRKAYPYLEEGTEKIMVWPRSSGRPPCPPEVPEEIAEDYNEACLVLPVSPKASAALSRRCLQNLLRKKAGVKHGNLSDEIQEVIDSGKLPSHLAESLDAIRIIGNFAAHPIKSTKSGEIIPVEPEEAEWNLDVLEGLFDFYYVQPAKIKKKRDELNRKLEEAGKKPMK